MIYPDWLLTSEGGGKLSKYVIIADGLTCDIDDDSVIAEVEDDELTVSIVDDSLTIIM